MSKNRKTERQLLDEHLEESHIYERYISDVRSREDILNEAFKIYNESHYTDIKNKIVFAGVMILNKYMREEFDV